MVFQHFNLFNNLNVIQNLMLAPVQLKKASKEKAKEEAMAMLKKVGLADKADAYPHQLSGGQKQRIAIARVFLKNPPILILDDTTSALDMETEAEIQENLNNLDFECTKLIIAQRTSSARYADRIIILEDGRIKECGTHDELMKLRGYYYEIYTLQNGTEEEAV